MTPVAFRFLGCGDPRRDIPETLTRRQVRFITAGVVFFDIAVGLIAAAVFALALIAS